MKEMKELPRQEHRTFKVTLRGDIVLCHEHSPWNSYRSECHSRPTVYKLQIAEFCGAAVAS